RHDRAPARHRLGAGDGQALPPRRADAEERAAVERGDGVPSERAEKPHTLREPEPIPDGEERGTLQTVPRDEEVDGRTARGNPRDGLEEDVEALLADEPAHRRRVGTGMRTSRRRRE